MNPEPVFDVAHLAHIELLTPRLEESARFFVEVMGMVASSREGDSVYLRGWDDYEHHSLQHTTSPLPGLGHYALRASSPQALQRRVDVLEKSGCGLGWQEKNVGHGPAYCFTGPDDHRMEIYYETEWYQPSEDLRPALKNQASRLPNRGILATDADGDPDVLKLGDLTLFVIKRGERFAVRVKDPTSPVRLGFTGIDNCPVDAAYRVTADFVPYDKPKAIAIPTVLGTTEMQQAPGIVKFRLHGKDLTLEPIVEDPSCPNLFFIFKDGTSADDTYPSGRFLYADMPKDGKVVLDFNRAYNPPCAFTPFATCPLPPKQNWLPVRVEAGEKRYGHR